MLEQLPYEVLLRVCSFINPLEENERYPDYVFRYPPRALIPLSQTSKRIRRLLLPQIVRYLSLVRKYETQAYIESSSIRNANNAIELLEDGHSLVQELEIHSGFIDIISGTKFNNIKSLTILGPIDTAGPLNSFLMNKKFAHLSISLPADGSVVSVPSSLKRLDILVRSDESLKSLNDCFHCNIRELNITSKGFAGILLSNNFVDALKNLNQLESLSIRKRGSYSAASTVRPYGLSKLLDFFMAISKLGLRTFAIDVVFLRIYADYLAELDESLLVQRFHSEPQLDVILIEPSLGSPLTTYQELVSIKFLLGLSQGQSIKSIELVFGLQTEIVPTVSIMVLQRMLEAIYASDRFIQLRTVEPLYTLMAWNTREDSQLVEQQRTLRSRSLLSYQKDLTFAPTYKSLKKYSVETEYGTNNVPFRFTISPECIHDDMDYEFWSQETIARDLERYSNILKRSSLWD